MQHFRSSLIALAVLMLLGAYIALFERGPAEKGDENRLLAFAADEVSSVRIERAGGDSAAVVLERKDGEWRLREPRPYRADEDAMRSLLNTATSLEPQRTLEEPGSSSDYGLDPPEKGRAVFTLKDGKAVTVLVGGESVAGGSRFLRVEGDPRVHLVASYQADNLLQSVTDLRNKHVFRTGIARARRVRLRSEGRTVELVKGTDGRWSLAGPRRAPAGEEEVRNFLNTLDNLRVTEFVSDAPPSLAPYGLDAPRRRVEVWHGEEKDPDVLWVGRKKAGTHYVYVKTGWAPVYLAGEYIDRETNKKAQDFRDKDILAFDPSKPVKLKVTYGGKTRLYEKKDGAWTAQDRPEAVKEASEILGLASAAKISDFAEPAGRGLESPRAVVEITLEGGDVRTIRYGKRENGKVWVNTEPGGEAFLVPASPLSQIETYFSE